MKAYIAMQVIESQELEGPQFFGGRVELKLKNEAEGMLGVLAVFSSLEALRKVYPNCAYTVGEVPDDPSVV